jgi:hypothetical protein
MKQAVNKKIIPLAGVGLAVLLLLGFWMFRARAGTGGEAGIKPTPRSAPVNTIPVADRPYIELAPLSSRNDLALTIHEPPLKADVVELTLEYDRNKGVLDAVLKNFTLNTFPFTATIFLGSKSTGGHITYHDDVTGGDILLKFDGGKAPYALKNPWRYDDTQTEYTEFGTRDGKFQLTFAQPWRTPKLLIMQSPGLPAKVDSEVIAGPYLVRGVGALPDDQVSINAHVSAESAPQLLGFDSGAWQAIDSAFADKTLTATAPLYEAFVITR